MHSVALFTGAWIEINVSGLHRRNALRRALYGRVDWNSFTDYAGPVNHESRSLRARGLKLLCRRCHVFLLLVALFTGAWIEIFFSNSFSIRNSMSRSLRARGLKCQTQNACRPPAPKSRSLRARGLKCKYIVNNCVNPVSRSLRARGLKYKNLFLK